MRLALLPLLLVALSCTAPFDPPKSICDLPRNFAGWSGTDVRWKGVVVGGPPHGYSLAAEECQRRGIALDGTPNGWSPLGDALEQRGLETGLLRADVSGKIVERDGSYRLLVTKVHHLAFEPMSEAAYYAYWRSKGF